ncbi:DNA polymerase Y family protein [Niveibacterium sp. SC-1]|uniref:Y-family DNA polymerase n=1 Tax=Niveibacterium sp. SC-1 TaxID=3135646 RepID=UPI00311ED73A
MLWLALAFTRLPLEVLVAPDKAPVLVAEQQRVVCSNAAGEAAGLTRGLPLAAALSLAPGTGVHERQPARETEALARLACWAGGFTPHVSLVPPQGLLLEVGGCLRLFGNLRMLCQRIRESVAAQGFSLAMAAAPTPRAAQWLVQGAAGAPASARFCLRPDRLADLLAPLPLSVLGLDVAQLRTLATLGVRSLGELSALPAAGLARRFGPLLPLQLAQARGEVPDLRSEFPFPEHFSQGLELPARVDHAAMLFFAARRLLASLAGWLTVRAAGVAECVLQLEHEDAEPSALTLAFAGPTRELERMERVLRERLERLELREPVVELRLIADAPLALAGSTLGLFAQSSTQALAPVVERLRARLGKTAVHGLQVVADHRPERATACVAQGIDARTAPAPQRPLWLLRTPRALPELNGAPHHEGPLRRLTRAEILESGWWDSGEAALGDVRREYCIALSAHEEWLWIYRDAQGWWLHGVFA